MAKEEKNYRDYFNTPTYRLTQQYDIFKMNWDFYTVEEKKILINSFRKDFHDLNNKPFEI